MTTGQKRMLGVDEMHDYNKGNRPPLGAESSIVPETLWHHGVEEVVEDGAPFAEFRVEAPFVQVARLGVALLLPWGAGGHGDAETEWRVLGLFIRWVL